MALVRLCIHVRTSSSKDSSLTETSIRVRNEACLTVSNFILNKVYTGANFLGRQDVETYF